MHEYVFTRVIAIAYLVGDTRAGFRSYRKRYYTRPLGLAERRRLGRSFVLWCMGVRRSYGSLVADVIVLRLLPLGYASKVIIA